MFSFFVLKMASCHLSRFRGFRNGERSAARAEEGLVFCGGLPKGASKAVCTPVASRGLRWNVEPSYHFYLLAWILFSHNSISPFGFYRKANLGDYPNAVTVCGRSSCGGLGYVRALLKKHGGGVHLQADSGRKIVFPSVEKQALCNFCVCQRCWRVWPLTVRAAVCLLICLPAFWSPSPSLNSTFLCSMKALHSKDLTTQEWVTSFSFFFSFSPPFCSLHPSSFGCPLPSQKLLCCINRAGWAEGLYPAFTHDGSLGVCVCLCVPFSPFSSH